MRGCRSSVVTGDGCPILGLTDISGWNLYSRVAPFADCGKFTPPEGTAILCQERPPSKRPGPFGYVWDLESVPRKRFELGPKTGRKLGEFAKRAIIHQPWDYASSVLIDLVRFMNPLLLRSVLTVANRARFYRLGGEIPQ